MLLYRWFTILTLLLSLTACKQDKANTKQASSQALGSSIFVDIGGLSQYKDVSTAVLAELAKHKEFKLVTDRKDANIYLGVNAIVPEEINELSKTNFVVLSYVLVNFDNKNATEGLGLGQRNLLEPFVNNLSSVLASFIKQPTPETKKN